MVEIISADGTKKWVVTSTDYEQLCLDKIEGEDTEAQIKRLGIKVIESKQRPIIKIEGELDFEPSQIIWTDDVPEALLQNWLECLPRWREYSKIRIVGNNLIITPVDIVEVQ